MFDPHLANFDPNAFPPALRAVSLVLALAIVGAILLQTAATAAAIVA